MYINDLPNGLKSNEELFADDTSLFTIVKDKNESEYSQRWSTVDFKLAYKWRMLFNPDPKNLPKKYYFQEKSKFKII